MKIILASESFLKNFIFAATKLEYKKVPADIDETVFDDQPVDQRVVSLALEKCQKVAELYTDDFIISADTLISCDGTVFQKPSTPSEAFERSLSLSGKTIEVFTGTAVYYPSKGFVTQLTKGEVTYSNFTENDLRRLTTEDNPQIRNGLGVFTDSPGFTLVESWNGSYTGLMGLPMEFVYPQLRDAKLID